jgi:hypothetical protein
VIKKCNKEKWTNKVIDKILKETCKKIIRLNNYIDIHTKINWQCELCLYIWNTTWATVKKIKTPGCKSCHKKIKLTNDMVDKKLIEQNLPIIRISNFKNADSHARWKCKIEDCLYEWETSPNKILNKEKTGCPKCAGSLKVTNEDIDNLLKNRNIKRLSDFSKKEITTRKKTMWQCRLEKCKFIWGTSADSILNRNHGCPKCAGNAKLTNQIIDDLLINENRNIKRLDDYINARTKSRWQCMNEDCKFIWATTSDSVVNRGTGCPNCKLSRGEKIINEILIKNCIKFKNHYTIAANNRNYIVDFYLYDYNLIIEYNGIQHYLPVNFNNQAAEDVEKNLKKQKIRDRELRKHCKNNNINLLEIDGRKHIGINLRKMFSQLEKLLIKKLGIKNNG